MNSAIAATATFTIVGAAFAVTRRQVVRARLTFVALVILCCGSVFAQVAQERQMGGVGLTIFSDTNYRGRSATLREDTPDLTSIGMNDLATSLEVGPGEQWEVCEHANYQGRCVVVSGFESDLRRSGWARIISSARRVRPGVGIQPPVGIRPPIGGITPPIPPVPGLELFSGINFNGNRVAFSSAQVDLRRVNFNDAAQSLRLAPGQVWQVCVDANFVNCLAINTDWPDLRGLGMWRNISSVRPWPQGGGTGIGQAFIVLFDSRNYGGRSLRVDRDTPTMSSFTNRAQSVQVAGGSWQLCDRSSFGGRCVLVSRNIPDLASIGMQRRVASVRLAR